MLEILLNEFVVNHLHLHVLGGEFNRMGTWKFPPGNTFFYADAGAVIARLQRMQQERPNEEEDGAILPAVQEQE